MFQFSVYHTSLSAADYTQYGHALRINSLFKNILPSSGVSAWGKNETLLKTKKYDWELLVDAGPWH